MKLLLYSESNSSRLQYVCQQVFYHWLGLSIEWTNNIETYQHFKGVKINYGKNTLLDNDFLLAKTTLLFENNIKRRAFFPISYNKIPAFFPTQVPNSIFPFDLLATLFLHLSRYEEYLPFQADRHGRFPASESWAYQNGYLQEPIVDLLVRALKTSLKKHYPQIVFKPQIFQFSPTYDIDMAWAYHYKGWKRNIGGYATDITKGQFISLKNRLRTHLSLQQDPFQTFDWLDGLSQKFRLSPIYFFLLGDYGEYDKNNKIDTPAFQHLVQSIANIHKIGIHPSYQSNNKQAILHQEKQRLHDISQQSIHRSRQHYLKVHLPTTYQQLITAGITDDYSMGYAMDIGFRAGTSLPFYWYDLSKEAMTKLKIHPFQVMEVTLKEYLKLSPEAAKEKITSLLNTVKSVNGTFCSLWHNSSFSELEGWNEWEAVYVDLLEKVHL